MKRIAALILLLVLTLAAASCGAETTSPKTPTNSPSDALTGKKSPEYAPERMIEGKKAFIIDDDYEDYPLDYDGDGNADTLLVYYYGSGIMHTVISVVDGRTGEKTQLFSDKPSSSGLPYDQTFASGFFKLGLLRIGGRDRQNVDDALVLFDCVGSFDARSVGSAGAFVSDRIHLFSILNEDGKPVGSLTEEAQSGTGVLSAEELRASVNFFKYINNKDEAHYDESGSSKTGGDALELYDLLSELIEGAEPTGGDGFGTAQGDRYEICFYGKTGREGVFVGAYTLIYSNNGWYVCVERGFDKEEECYRPDPEDMSALISKLQKNNSFEKISDRGEPPAELERVLSGNMLKDAVAFDGCFFRFPADENGACRAIERYDRYGVLTAAVEVPAEEFYYSVKVLTTTGDGGFLYLRGYSDQYIYEEKKYASDLGADTFICKCDAEGREEWRITTEIEGDAFAFGFETDDGFLLCGTKEEPDIKGNCGKTDIYLTRISKGGKITATRNIGGSDFDRLNYAAPYKNGYLLYARVQSTDGDFEQDDHTAGSRRTFVFIDRDMNVLEKTPSETMALPQYVGVHKGARVDTSSPIFSAFPYGKVTAILDYDGYFVVVSRNAIGVIETPPQVSAIWYKYQTVCVGYDEQGTVLWIRTCEE